MRMDSCVAALWFVAGRTDCPHEVTHKLASNASSERLAMHERAADLHIVEKRMYVVVIITIRVGMVSVFPDKSRKSLATNRQVE